MESMYKHILKRMAEGGEAEGPEDYDYLEECMRGLIEAVKKGDAKLAAEHFEEAFEHLEARPHEEGGEEDGEESPEE